MSEWQPIETAPMNQWIIVVVSGVFEPTGKPYRPAIAMLCGGNQVKNCDSRYHLLEDWPISHWMEIPEPPK